MAKKKLKPNFQHDCNTCQLLGRVIIKGIVWDLYFCSTLTWPTLVARYSDGGSRYTSGMEFGKMAFTQYCDADGFEHHNQPLMIAYVLAEVNGLVSRTEFLQEQK